MKRIKSKNIVIVAHKFVTHPDDELVVFLNKKKLENVLHIGHSFYEAPDRKSYYIWYKRGKIYKKKETLNYNFLPLPLLYAKEMFFTLLWILTSGVYWDKYIGMDGLCTLFGNSIRTLRRVKKTVYWAIDFVPNNRFSSATANKIYHKVNIHGYKNSDEMWDLSPRMAEAREKFLGIKRSDYKAIRVVPYGVWTDRVKKYRYSDCKKNTIVFMGRLIESQGVQLVLRAIPFMVKANPKFKFKIIGDGPYRNELVRYAKQLKVYKYCDFRGKIHDHQDVEDEIASSCVAVAPYIKNLDKWTYYADPGKVKTYLACGVPVVLTDLPWNSKEIERNKCGIVIDERIDLISEKILYAMKPSINRLMRVNAILYAQNFSYDSIFGDLVI